jgi:diguanylate cyclase (GGDEF)-like protein
MSIGVLAMVYINKGQQYVPIWSFLFIYLSMVMYGHKKGLIVSLLYCTILLSMFASWVGDTITHLEFLRFSAVILVTVLFTFLSELTITTTLQHLRNSQKKLQEMTLTDALTNVYNRRQFDFVFTTTMNSVKRNNQLLAFVMIDIDFFKRYNDTYGHQQGDQALIDVAHFLKNKMKRANDAIFRLGGEEFALLFSVENHQQALAITQEVIQGIEALQITHEKSGVSQYLTVSAGLFVIENSSKQSKDEIYKACDDLLYQAKGSGRNQVATDITL